MHRINIVPRANWQTRVEEVGLTYHTPGGVTYWDESAYYAFTTREVEVLESAANEMHQLCIGAAQHVIDEERFAELNIPADAVPLIINSWERDDFSLYGRFDFVFDGVNPSKLLEYNADTPTSLIEAAVAQWFWLQDCFPKRDQFNSIHERLIEAWRRYAKVSGAKMIHLGGEKDHLEDQQTVFYLEDTCHQAGLGHARLAIQEVGLDTLTQTLVDVDNQAIEHFFKLYPWEWIWHYGDQNQALKHERTRFLEPIWKMLLSNKGILPVLWELNPGHPNLLPAYASKTGFKAGEAPHGCVRKPKLSREGANITLFCGDRVIEETPGEYGQEGCIYQALQPIPEFDGNHPVMGIWMVDHECAGLGIREDKALITGNCSRFIPHVF